MSAIPPPVSTSPRRRIAASASAVGKSAVGAAGAENEPAPDDASACAADLIDVLPLVMATLRGGMRRNISDGLSVPQFRCLAFIDRQPGASVSEATAFLGVTMATTSAMIDRLALAGYVQVSVSAADRRRSVITVSDSGRELLKRMRQGGKLELSQALSVLSKAELSTLRKAAALLHRSFHRG